MNTLKLGQHYEDVAKRYLTTQGLKLLARNYQYAGGEIDLIMQDQNTWVFIEVRFKKSDLYGHAEETVNQRKQKKIILTAKHYLIKQQLYDKVHCRFDVVAITASNKEQTPTINWFRNAFSLEDYLWN